MDKMNQEIQAFVKEYNRLLTKYGDNRTITIKSFWQWNYVEDEIESIEYYGGKQYAQFTLYNIGAIPVEEVDAWK